MMGKFTFEGPLELPGQGHVLYKLVFGMWVGVGQTLDSSYYPRIEVI